MKAVFQVLPLAVLVIGAGVLVWRGMARKPDGTHNSESHGGNVDTH